MKPNVVSRSKFAALVGVNPSTVTRLCGTVLKAAVSGRGIDAAHPCAVAYRKKQHSAKTPPPATGLDNRYEEAVEFCQNTGRYTVSSLRRGMHLGETRAKAIFETMRASGLIPPEPGPPLSATAKVPTLPLVPKLKGQAATKETKKRATTPEDQIYDIPEDIEAFLDFTLRDIIAKFGQDYKFVDWLNATQKIEAINEKRLKNAQTKGKLVSRLLMKAVIDLFNSAHLRLLKDGATSITAGVIAKHASGASEPECVAYTADILGSFIKPVKSQIVRVLKDVPDAED